MKKSHALLLVTAAGLIGLAIGFKSGQQDVISNQIITSENQEEGFYQSEYQGNQYKYWYEEEYSIMDQIEQDIVNACGQDPYCSDLYVEC